MSRKAFLCRPTPSFACLTLLVAGTASFVPSVASAAEPLTIRVADAIGAPGQPTAIVLRTYAPRPIRRGKTTAAVASGFAPNGSSPLASVQGITIFSSAGGGDIEVTSLTFNDSTGVIVAEFESSSATINAEDGVLAVIHATVGAGSSPGACWDITLSPAEGANFFTDPDDDGPGDEIPLEFRNGEICIRGPLDPLEFEVDGGKVHPGSTAIIELGTAEPYAIESGRIVLDYDATLFTGLPIVETDPRHGSVEVIVSHPQVGRLQIDLSSSDDTFNTIPGDILRILMPTDRETALETTSPLVLQTGPGLSELRGPGNALLSVTFASDQIEFEKDLGIFTDDFETGDYWIWNAAVP